MNKNKISPKLLNAVSIQSKGSAQRVYVTSNDFEQTKKLLNDCKYSYKPYRFASCFCLSADYDDLNILSNQNNVNYIYENALVTLEKYEKEMMNIVNLTENKFLGQGQTICFIDTGIFPHFDFVFPHNRIVKFIDLTNKNSTPYDDNGHGTFVAGVACGAGVVDKVFTGFAPLANIVMIKALGKAGNSDSNVILDAMQWVYENHRAYNISIVCMSFGADVDFNLDPLSRGAQSLWKRGLTVVAAAGNSGPNKNTIKSPGNNPYIITVGGLDVDKMSTADFSSRGPTVYGHKPDLLAPAVDVSSCNNLNTPYTSMSGTSVATPIVAGICADIKSRWPKMTNDEIKKFLLSHCVKISGDADVEGAGYLKF